ncbi:MAG: peptidylprolyl isomerase [Rhodothermales bacterium]|nr:peptidylprolyl isomerase [Rhodothermales bacterium]
MVKSTLFLFASALLMMSCEVRVRDGSPTGLTGTLSDSLASARVQSDRPVSGSIMDVPVTVANPPVEAQSNFYEIVTPYGSMTVRLYDDTPQHRDNFKKLVAEGFYDGTTFHRVMPEFMIQGGDPNSKDDDPYNDGIGGPGYTVPAEFNPALIHKKGALAAARQPDQVNPERRSSGSQFYIVHGRVFQEAQLSDVEQGMPSRIGEPAFQFSGEARRTYMRDGGAPFLDMQYTVFGELVSGFDTLDRIAQVSTNESDRPLEPVSMTVRPARGL